MIYRLDDVAAFKGEALQGRILSLGIGIGCGGRSTKKIDHETRVVKYGWGLGEQTCEFYHFLRDTLHLALEHTLRSSVYALLSESF
jgi:hypothetical protein